MIKVPNLEILKALPSIPEEGEQAILEESRELYEYSNGEWQRCGGTDITISLYEINKQAMAKAPAMSDESIKNAQDKIKKYIEKQKNKYYMLLCKDISYYTLFVGGASGAATIDEEVIECIKDLGVPLAIEKTKDKVFEIWIKNENGVFALYFFPYDLGVIKCQ